MKERFISEKRYQKMLRRLSKKYGFTEEAFDFILGRTLELAWSNPDKAICEEQLALFGPGVPTPREALAFPRKKFKKCRYYIRLHWEQAQAWTPGGES